MSATIYFAGGEEIDFNIIEGVFPPAFNNTAGNYRSDWSRGGISIQNGINGAHFPDSPGFASFWRSPIFDSVSDFWWHAQVSIEFSATDSGINCFGFASPDGKWRLAVQGTGTSGQWRLIKRDASAVSTTLATSAAGVFTGGGIAFGGGILQLDAHIVYGTSGSFDLYLNGSNTAAISYTGDITTNSATQINRFFGASHRAANVNIWSEAIVADSDTRAMGLLTLAPDSDGNTQDWLGSASDINETSTDDTTFVNSNTNNQISEWTTTVTIPTGNWDVETVWQTVRINKGADGPQHFDFVIRPASGSTDYPTTDYTPAAGFGNLTYQWPTNPDTSMDWIVADIGTGFNIGVESKA